MRSMTKIIASLAASAALLLTSSAAVAAAPAPAPAQRDAWMMLSMLSPTGATALGGATVTAQPVDMPPAVPPAAAARAGGFVTPPIPVLLVWLGVIGLDVYLLTREHHHPVPNSPG